MKSCVAGVNVFTVLWYSNYLSVLNIRTFGEQFAASFQKSLHQTLPSPPATFSYKPLVQISIQNVHYIAMSQKGRGGRFSPYVERYFKAMTEDQIKRMQESFNSEEQRAAQTDNFYFQAFQARRAGDQTFIATPHTLKAHDAKAEAVSYDDSGLGAVRLRHTSTAQPLVPDDRDISFSMPTDSNEVRLEQLWNYLLQLEDMSRATFQQNESKKQSIVTYIVRSLQVELVNTSAAAVDPSKNKRFAYFMNDKKGQGFLTRFIKMLDHSLLKRFFFTAFIVFQDVNVDSRSPFALEFMTTLSHYLQQGVKPRWVAAFIRQACSGGFAQIAASRFKSACVAMLLTRIQSYKNLDEGNSKLREQVVRELAESMEKGMAAALKTRYDALFMNVIFKAVMAMARTRGLQTMLVASAI